MSDEYTEWTGAATDDLRQRLNSMPSGSRLQVRGTFGHLFARVVPPGPRVARTADDPPDINDTFPCPGSPGCI